MDYYEQTKDIKCQHCSKLIGQDGLCRGFFDPYMELHCVDEAWCADCIQQAKHIPEVELETEEISPCPKCGKAGNKLTETKKDLVRSFIIKCEQCGHQSGTGTMHDGNEKIARKLRRLAIASWNHHGKDSVLHYSQPIDTEPSREQDFKPEDGQTKKKQW